ncbi:MAG: hypothetical protein ACPGO0_03820, partial [Acidimicrobiales bacterium]
MNLEDEILLFGEKVEQCQIEECYLTARSNLEKTIERNLSGINPALEKALKEARENEDEPLIRAIEEKMMSASEASQAKRRSDLVESYNVLSTKLRSLGSERLERKLISYEYICREIGTAQVFFPDDVDAYSKHREEVLGSLLTGLDRVIEAKSAAQNWVKQIGEQVGEEWIDPSCSVNDHDEITMMWKCQNGSLIYYYRPDRTEQYYKEGAGILETARK